MEKRCFESFKVFSCQKERKTEDRFLKKLKRHQAQALSTRQEVNIVEQSTNQQYQTARSLSVHILIVIYCSRFFSSKPHVGGSQRQKELADHIASKWRQYGFDEVEMPEYQVLLSLPQEDQPNTVEVVTNGLVDYTITGRIEVSFRFYHLY